MGEDGEGGKHQRMFGSRFLGGFGAEKKGSQEIDNRPVYPLDVKETTRPDGKRLYSLVGPGGYTSRINGHEKSSGGFVDIAPKYQSDTRHVEDDKLIVRTEFGQIAVLNADRVRNSTEVDFTLGELWDSIEIVDGIECGVDNSGNKVPLDTRGNTMAINYNGKLVPRAAIIGVSKSSGEESMFVKARMGREIYIPIEPATREDDPSTVKLAPKRGLQNLLNS